MCDLELKRPGLASSSLFKTSGECAQIPYEMEQTPPGERYKDALKRSKRVYWK